MNMFSIITTVIIVSINMIVIGYVAPYVTLTFYAIQRKTTIKSLRSLVNEYDGLLDAFSMSKILGYSMAVFLPVYTLQTIKDASSHTEVIVAITLCQMGVLGFIAFMISADIETVIEYSDDCLREQPIKI